MNIKTRSLPQEDADRLYIEHPHLRSDYEDYCPTCRKEGTYQWDGEEHVCDCQMQLQLYKHYLNAGIGVTYQRLHWSDFNGDPKILDQIAKYVLAPDKYITRGVGLILVGDFGTGKTMLATLALKEFVKKGYTCYSTTFANMVDMLTASWYDQEERLFFRRKVLNSEVLLLDDLGKELKRKNSLSETTFDNILRTRMQAGRPTFITTNMNRDELEEGYGAAVLSLLVEGSILYVLEGDDFRRRSNERTLEEIERGLVRPIF